MIMIDAQTFEMGCTAEMSSCGADEYPAHTVTLTNAFYMAEMEVTQDQYWAMRGLDPSYFSSCGGNCPVDDVSAHRAAAFANAVSDVEGLERCYECDFYTCTVLIEPYACRGYRLPTEAEWEAAARCGEPTLYAGSAVVDDVAWYSGNSGATTHPVGTKAPNACGLYDMSGNVMEWTADSYSSTGYETSASINPWAGTSDQSVCRGGWARDGTAYVRVTERTMNWTGGAAMFTGFRIARSAGL
jgi:formylglycine-generating enzyme required for sulfatase activity